MSNVIAKRDLFWSSKGSNVRNKFTVRVGVPFDVEQSEVPFGMDWIDDTGASACAIDTDGLEDEYHHVVYGLDEIQAVNMASNIEPMLKGLAKKYDLFWLSGEPYS